LRVGVLLIITLILGTLIYSLHITITFSKEEHEKSLCFGKSNLKKWLTYKKEVKKNREPFNILVIGDSSTTGVGASNPEKTSCINLLEEDLRFTYGFAGEGMKNSIAPDKHIIGKYTYSDKWVGGWDELRGFANSSMYSVTDGETVEWEFEGETLGIIFGQHNKFNNGNAVITIDNNINTYIDIDKLSNEGYVYMLHGLEPNAKHKVKLEVSINNNEIVVFNGSYSLQNNKGVIVNNCSLSGSTSGMWINNYTDTLIKYLKPQLTIICLGANDWNVGESILKYKENIQWLVRKSKAQGDVLLMSYGIFPDNHKTQNEQDISILVFRNVAKAIAKTENIAYIDIIGLWKDSNYYAKMEHFLSDNVHANDKGQKYIYEQIKKMLY
jgi:lysophospholipase L1-like esterase